MLYLEDRPARVYLQMFGAGSMTMPTHTNVASDVFSHGIPSSYLPQVGVTVSHDLTLINNSYGVRGARKADLGQLATKHLGIGVGSRSLEDLCAEVLGQRLSKGSVRVSNWEQPLSEDQVGVTVVPRL